MNKINIVFAISWTKQNVLKAIMISLCVCGCMAVCFMMLFIIIIIIFLLWQTIYGICSKAAAAHRQPHALKQRSAIL